MSNAIVGKEYLGSMEGRLASVERRLERLEAQGPPEEQLPLGESPGGQLRESPKPVLCTNAPGGNKGNQSLPLKVNGGTDQAPIDPVELARGEDDDEIEIGYVGPSSNTAFTRHISRAVLRLYIAPETGAGTGNPERLQPFQDDSMTQSARHLSSSKVAASNWRSQPQIAQDVVNLYERPSDVEAMSLIDMYFADTGLLFPYLHEETFRATYEAMKRDHWRNPQKTWLAILNVVFAVGTSMNISANWSAQDRAAMSDTYYQRALGLCERQIWQGCTVELVQCLLLMGQYLQGMQFTQTWIIHGLAVKAAFQVGLHSAERSKTLAPIDREMRKRIWTLSMTFGRPASIPESYVRLELPVAVDTDHPLSQIDTRKRNGVDLFNATICLYRVMWKVIDTLYDGNMSCDTSISIFDTGKCLIELERDLVEWERSVPGTLGLKTLQDIQSIHEDPDLQEKCGVILTLRYQNLRILAHRPILVRFLQICGDANRNDRELALLQQIGSPSIEVCIQSSREIITIANLIVQSTGTRRGLLGAWWSSLYFTFNAGLVIFACALVNQTVGFTRDSLSESLATAEHTLQVAVNALLLLDNGNKVVEKCARYLGRLAQFLSYFVSNVAVSTPSSTVRYPWMGAEHLASDLPSSSSTIIPQMSMPDFGSHQARSGMDLGGFMMESDLDFLNYFRVPPT
ncbi:uncharacterized protein BP5553_06412 [Venustampulla echinocandica]|uniref:Xylanolytic transcriptional activator regulatory domain-containing protein n=1 Tax=Venustampulla echinocandica TaxID=2656787 RepID=A0A370TJU8_9HELO|nr:uncharacterized protein BP5553_06412 [Venustampulla echinocandica]RDL35800.1 hypothetical protein BP5553_06412 [Venustampulla echinocandica]